MKKSVLERLLKLNIPIFFAKGTNDKNSCIEGTDILPIEFLRYNKSNLAYKTYWGLDHCFADSGKSNLKIVLDDFAEWINKI